MLLWRKDGVLPVSTYQVGRRLPASVWHPHRFARFGAEYVQAALEADGRELLVVDPAEVDDDLVRDVTEILASLCVRLYGRGAAAVRAARMVGCVTVPDCPDGAP